MAHMIPGWPGPTLMGTRSQVAPVPLPILPGAQGGALPGAQAGALPGAQAGAPATESPLARLAAYGVPVTQLPNGQMVIGGGGAGAGAGSAGPAMPPDIPGMPKMPSPPTGWTGDSSVGGLMQPASPVQPFNPANLAQQQTFGNPAAAMQRLGPVSLGSLLPPE